jgi:RNA polymerase-binding transcription factor DksA
MTSTRTRTGLTIRPITPPSSTIASSRRARSSTCAKSFESGKPIPDARLELVPWAERTAEEQARHERVA